MKLNSKTIAEVRKMMNVTGMIPIIKIFEYVNVNNLKTDSQGNLLK